MVGFSGVPNKGTKSELVVSPLPSQSQKWAEMLHNPCIPQGPQQRGQNQSTKKKRKKHKIFLFIVSLILFGVLRFAPIGD